MRAESIWMCIRSFGDFEGSRVRRDLPFVSVLIAICGGLACGANDTEGGPSQSLQRSRATPPGQHTLARCYQSPHSVLFGPSAKSRQNGQGPGWLRIDGLPGADSGPGEVVDANRAGLGAMWHRGSVDSVLLVGADDFLRVELRLSVSDSVATGSALATSDADVERNASDQGKTFRRDWILHAVRAPCDSMPKRSMDGKA